MFLPAGSVLPTARRAVVVAAALLATLATAVPLAHAAPSAPTGVRQDFDGDGYEDLAVAAPHGTVGGRTDAGYVAVVYGSAGGLAGGTKKVYTQDSAGIPGTAEAGDLFGSRLVTADLDGDGFTDLLVDAAREQWTQGGIAREGSRTVLWGGPGGLTTGTLLPAEGDGRQQSFFSVAGDFDGDGHQDLARSGRVAYGPFGRDGVPASARTGPDFVDGDLLTVAVAAGDTDGDGTTDLVSLARSYDWDDEGRYGYGLYQLRGSRDGLLPPTALKNLPDPEGSALALGDLDGDRRADLVLGGDSLRILRAGPDGLAGGTAREITQDTPGVPGAQEAGDGFGSALSVGDVDGDGYGDVLAGIPYEDFDGIDQAGTFAVVPGGPAGPTGAGTKVLSQNSAEVPGTAEEGDTFGAGTDLLDGDGDGRAEPVVAAPGENSFAGAVWAFRSTSAGVTAQGSFSFGASALGMPVSRALLGSVFPR
ncbi:FG-GAP repeat protein [Streptomyces sp. NPDC052682]|uniref:FG-GAP repeat protein n=1 Tax=Streptomyces sp. NPDC052682 TaxID=3154954 RepID=UPI003414749F